MIWEAAPLPCWDPSGFPRILEAVAAHFPLSKDCEITAEANPRAAEGDTIAALGRLGFTRVSFGMQSAVSSELRLLGRRHTREEVAQSVELARQGGIDNISLDVMLGVIGQTAPSLSQTLDFAASLKPTHISAYILKVEEGTVYNSPRFLSRNPRRGVPRSICIWPRWRGFPPWAFISMKFPTLRNLG